MLYMLDMFCDSILLCLLFLADAELAKQHFKKHTRGKKNDPKAGSNFSSNFKTPLYFFQRSMFNIWVWVLVVSGFFHWMFCFSKGNNMVIFRRVYFSPFSDSDMSQETEPHVEYGFYEIINMVVVWLVFLSYLLVPFLQLQGTLLFVSLSISGIQILG